MQAGPHTEKLALHVDVGLLSGSQGHITSCLIPVSYVMLNALRLTVPDNQSPPILWPWVFLFGTLQEQLRRLGNAGKHLFRVHWRDWHEPIILKLNIYLFALSNFGHPPKQLDKNAEKCAIDSFWNTEDDPIKTGQFSQAIRQIYDL